MKQSLKIKLLVVFVLVISIPLVVLGTLTYRSTEKVVYKGYEESNLAIVKEVEYGVEKYMNSYKMAIEIFASNESSKNVYTDIAAKKMMMLGFESFLAENPDVLFLYMGTTRGDMFDPSWPDVPDDYDPTSRPWYQVAEETKETTWTAPYVDADTGEMIISLSTPVYNKAKKMIGVVAMDISLDSLSAEMNAIQIGQNGYPILIGPSNEVITHKDPAQIGGVLPIQDIVDALALSNEGLIEYEWNGSDKFATFKKVEELNWSVLVTMDHSEINALTRPILLTTIALMLICLVLGIAVAIFQARGLVKPILALEATMEKVKDGDLTVRSEVETKDEIGQMANNFNIMIDHFAEMLSKSKDVAHQVSISAEDLASSSEEVSASSDEVSRTIDEIAQGASEQASETEQGATLMNGLSEKIQVLTKDSDIMSEAAKSVVEANGRGTEAMNELKVKTNENSEATVRISTAVKELEKKSAEIGGILETITTIADQTNLLALNASIEAARAGEHGRGFAVVAEEIRKLAEGSGNAAENIGSIVAQIQDESKNTVNIMSEVLERSELQESAVESVDAVFEDIHSSTEKITDIIDEVAKFIDGVNTDKEKIVTSIGTISAVSEESAAASEEVTASVQQQTAAIEEVAKAAELLNSMADELQKEISVFKI